MTSVRTEATIRAALMDLDGTLADSLGAMRQAYARFANRHGFEATDVEFDSLNGPSLPEIVDTLARRHGLDTNRATLLADYEATIQVLYRDIAPAPGARGFLADCRTAGLKTAVVTSARASLCTGWLDATGLAECVDLVIGAEDSASAKPSAAPYEAALQRLDLAAPQAIAVEDSENGVRAARAAGLETIRIGTPAQSGSTGAGVHACPDLYAARAILAARLGRTEP